MHSLHKIKHIFRMKEQFIYSARMTDDVDIFARRFKVEYKESGFLANTTPGKLNKILLAK